MKSIILTGGGTAGHVTPNIALIRHLQQKGVDVHYLGTKDGIERDLVEPIEGVTYHCIRSGKLRRYFSIKNFTDPFKVIAGYFDARGAISQIKPSAIFSKGGFVSVPVVVAGKHKKVPVILHESDYTPGLANKIAISFASRILVTFEDTLIHTKQKGIFTGTPIRPELFGGDAKKGLDFLGFSGSKPILLCMGGSQGAQAINDALRNNLDNLLKSFDIAHLCGKGKISKEHEEIEGYVQFEYISYELPDIFAASSIALSRAGANSVFEFLAIALPSLLIPLPLAASRGDQIQNASYFGKKGYAMVLEQENITDSTLYEAIMALYEHKEKFLSAMKQDEHSDGTQAVLNQIYSIMGI